MDQTKNRLAGRTRIVMKRSVKIIVTLILAPFVSSCGTLPSATPSGPRSIELNGELVTESDSLKFISWSCTDYFDKAETLIEFGRFDGLEEDAFGFVLYDGSAVGEFAVYQRRGLDHRWDWGPDGGDYAFIIEPDGTGRYYDFSSVSDGESTSSSGLYDCADKSWLESLP
jgi:hypothetical protein